MNKINQMELQDLRHLILENETTHNKLSYYAQEASTNSFKNFFEKEAASSLQSKSQLMDFLK